MYVIEPQLHYRLSMDSQIFLSPECTNQLTFTKYKCEHKLSMGISSSVLPKTSTTFLCPKNRGMISKN